MKIKPIVILGVIAIVLGGLWLWSGGSFFKANTFTSEQYGFTLNYPQGWVEKSLMFSSPSDQSINTKDEERCKNGCEGAFYKRGISFTTLPVNPSWLPIVEEKGMHKIGSIDWKVSVYDGSGLGILAYEFRSGSRSYVFWEFLSNSEKSKFESLLVNFKPL